MKWEKHSQLPRWPGCDEYGSYLAQDSTDDQGQQSALLLHSICQLLTCPGDCLLWCTADQDRTMAPVTSLEKCFRALPDLMEDKKNLNMDVCACVLMQTNQDIYNWQAAFHCLSKCWFLFYWESIWAASFSFPVAKAQTVALNLMENVKIKSSE